MRLFEVDQGSARDVLAVLQGLANSPAKTGNKQSSELPFPTVMNVLKPFALGVSTPDGLIALKNAIDPNGDVIKDILDNGTIILNTETPSSQEPAPEKKQSSLTVDKMASRAAKKP